MDVTSLALSKSYTNQKTNGMLHNLGYFNQVTDLPKTAQQSGINHGTMYDRVLETDLTRTQNSLNIANLPNLKTITGIETPYVFGFYADEDNYCFVSANKPSLIDAFSYGLDKSFSITLKGASSPDDVVLVHACTKGMRTPLPDGDPDGLAFVLPFDTESNNLAYYFAHDIENAGIVTPIPFMPLALPMETFVLYYFDVDTPIKIFGNLPTKVKYTQHLPWTYKRINEQPHPVLGWERIQEEAGSTSLTLAFANNYTYNEAMEALRFDEAGNAYWITDSDGAKTNDTAVVGENQLYVVNNNNEWKNLGGGSSEPVDLSSYATQKYVDEAITTAITSALEGEY